MYYFYLRIGKEWVLIGGGDADFVWELVLCFPGYSSKIYNLECQELWARC
jgi:hypothetical protein